MTQPDVEFGEFVRRSLHAAADSVVVGPDGLDRIRARLAAARMADAPWRGERAGLAGRFPHGWADWTPEHT
jgi:hypothetical protein